MENKSCCFTGHRNILEKDYNNIYNLTKNYIEKLILEQNVSYFKVGGARGFDTICSLCILELKKKYSYIKLILILPCKNQHLKWNEKDKELYNIVLENSDKIMYVSEEYTKDCMLKRNDKLLENSDYCICYLREKTIRGGTLYTFNRAKDKNIKIYNINDYLKYINFNLLFYFKEEKWKH